MNSNLGANQSMETVIVRPAISYPHRPRQ